MEKTYTLKACCALCEYMWDSNFCPLYKTYDAARGVGDYTFDEETKFRIVCDEFDIVSKFQQAEK